VSIFLVRHGETAWNAARIIQRRDTPLNERGIAQVERIAARLATVGVARILSSDLARATATARAIAARTGAPIDYDSGLRERDFGDVCGTPYAELTIDVFAADYVPPGGESWEAFYARVAAAWERVVAAARAGSGHLAVVTHGLVCHAFVDRHARCAELVPLRWHNASLTEIDAGPPWTARLVNCVAHLADETADGGPV
jgi:broad specificity phosphatase PhoE